MVVWAKHGWELTDICSGQEGLFLVSGAELIPAAAISPILVQDSQPQSS